MLDVFTIRSKMTSPTDPIGCKCEVKRHVGTSRHMNKEIPHFHYMDKDGNTHIGTTDGELSTIETNAVERLVEEHRQLEMFNPDGLPFVVEVTGEQLAAELDRLADTKNLPLIEDLQDGDMVEES